MEKLNVSKPRHIVWLFLFSFLLFNSFLSSKQQNEFSLNYRHITFLEGTVSYGYKVNPIYEYEGKDIDVLLNLRAKEEKIDLGRNIILPAISDASDQLGYQLQLTNQTAASCASNILIPLYLDQSHHWVGVVVSLNKYHKAQLIYYIDSLSNPIPQKIKSILQQIYGSNIRIKNFYGWVQADDTGCGPLLVENFIRVIKGIWGNRLATTREIREIRKHHISLAELYNPRLGLEYRQKYNLHLIFGPQFSLNEFMYGGSGRGKKVQDGDASTTNSSESEARSSSEANPKVLFDQIIDEKNVVPFFENYKKLASYILDDPRKIESLINLLKDNGLEEEGLDCMAEWIKTANQEQCIKLLKYAVEHRDYEVLEIYKEHEKILDNPDNIRDFLGLLDKHKLGLEYINLLIKIATPQQCINLLRYAKEYNKVELLNCLKEHEKILDDPDSVRIFLELLQEPSLGMECIDPWVKNATPSQRMNLLIYGGPTGLEILKRCQIDMGDEESFKDIGRMNALLKKYFGDKLKGGLMEVFDLSQGYTSELQRKLDEVIGKPSSPQIIVLPINVGPIGNGTDGYHWTALYIQHLQQSPPLIVYLDPLKGTILDKISEVLRDKYPGAEVINPKIKILNNPSDCGRWVVAVLDSLINDSESQGIGQEAKADSDSSAPGEAAAASAPKLIDVEKKERESLARMLTVPVSQVKQQGRMPKILYGVQPRPYRSFKDERERQILRQVATQLYLALKEGGLPGVGEIQVMHLAFDGKHYLFIAANQHKQDQVARRIQEHMRSMTCLDKILFAQYSPKQDKEGEGRMRSKRYALKLEKRTDDSVLSGVEGSDIEQAKAVADLININEKEKIEILELSMSPKEAIDAVINISQNDKIYLVIPGINERNRGRHAEEFLCDIVKYVREYGAEKTIEPHTCVGGKKRPCMSCFGRLQYEEINSYGRNPGFFWFNTFNQQIPDEARSTIGVLCSYCPSESICKNGKPTTEYDSGSNSSAEEAASSAPRSQNGEESNGCSGGDDEASGSQNNYEAEDDDGEEGGGREDDLGASGSQGGDEDRELSGSGSDSEGYQSGKVGNCLFDAIATFVANKNGEKLRNMAVQRLKQDHELQGIINAAAARRDKRDYLQTKSGKVVRYKNYKKYIKIMARDQTWGTYTEILALVRELKRTVRLHIPGGVIIDIEGEDKKPLIELDYINGNHFARHQHTDVPANRTAVDVNFKITVLQILEEIELIKLRNILNLLAKIEIPMEILGKTRMAVAPVLS